MGSERSWSEVQPGASLTLVGIADLLGQLDEDSCLVGLIAPRGGHVPTLFDDGQFESQPALLDFDGFTEALDDAAMALGNSGDHGWGGLEAFVESSVMVKIPPATPVMVTFCRSVKRVVVSIVPDGSRSTGQRSPFHWTKVFPLMSRNPVPRRRTIPT